MLKINKINKQHWKRIVYKYSSAWQGWIEWIEGGNIWSAREWCPSGGQAEDRVLIILCEFKNYTVKCYSF